MEEAEMLEMDIQATIKKAHKAMKVHAQITVVKTRIIPCISGQFTLTSAGLTKHSKHLNRSKLFW